MKLPTVPTTAVVNHMNTTYFNQVWNSPDDHGRVNVQLIKVSDRVQTGAVPVDLSVVGLPTTDKVYAVYRIPYGSLSRFIDMPHTQWVTDTSVFLPNNVSIVVYSSQGRSFPHGGIWMRYSQLRAEILIAIDVTYTKKCVGDIYPNLYMTMYKDTSRKTPVISSVFKVNTSSSDGTLPSVVSNAISSAFTSYPNGTIVTINGFIYDQSSIPSLANGDIVCIASDPDVIGYCDVSVDDNMTGYYSDKYGEYREVLHILKDLNPNNVIITTDTLSIVVLDKVSRKGVLGHRVNINAIESITHNDFSMSRTVIQDFSNSLDADEVIVRLYIRYPTEPNLLTDDINHIHDLYRLDDSDILNQLLGLSSKQIPEWKASHLEKSEFLDLLYSFDGFDIQTAIPGYVSAMGYYNVASVLGQQMRHYTYKGAQVEVIKPVRLYGYTCTVIAYSNGIKILDDQISTSNFKSESFLLGFKLGSGVKVGDRISLYIVEQGYRTPVPFSPTLSSPSITLENEDYTLFKMYTYTEDQPIWGNTVNKGFEEISLSPADYTVSENTDGTATYTVKTKHYGSKFYCIPKYGINTLSYDISFEVINKIPLVIPLWFVVTDGAMPVIGYESMEVYLNGKRLIENIDYKCSFEEGSNNDVLQNLLVISNNEYLNFDGASNIVEVIIHGDKIVSDDKGYAISNMMHRIDEPIVWSKSSGRAFVRGVLQENVTEVGNVLMSDDGITDGSPFLIQQMISYGALKLLGSISPNEDNSFRSRIDHCIGIQSPEYPDTVLIDDLYALYSPFLARVVTDVGYGDFYIVDDPSDTKFLSQFKDYSPMVERDPTIGVSNTLINRQFVTIAAHYANFAVQDPQQMIRVQRLIGLTLTPSELSIEEVLL